MRLMTAAADSKRLSLLVEAVSWLVETTALAAVAAALPVSDDRHRKAVDRLCQIGDLSGIPGVSPSDWAKTTAKGATEWANSVTQAIKKDEDEEAG